MMVNIIQWFFAILMMAAGINHFIYPRIYKRFIPKILPLNTTNYLVGLLEALVGLGLLLSVTFHLSALVLLIVMISFLPLHVMDVFKEKPAIGSKTLAYIRLPIQLLLIWGAWYLYVV